MPPHVAITWSPRALDRVAEVAQTIAQDRPKVVLRWLEEIMERVELLAAAPKQGRVVPELGRPEIREIFFGKYRVIYRVEVEQLVVLTVRHARRLFDPLEVEDE